MVSRAQGAGPERQGQLDDNLGYLGLCRSGCLPSQLCEGAPGTHARQGAGGSGLIPWGWGVGWGEGIPGFSDTMPHLCPASQPLCPVSPRSGAEIAHNRPEASDEGKRAPDHVPREAGPWQRGGVMIGQACPEKSLLGAIRSHQVGHRP